MIRFRDPMYHWTSYSKEERRQLEPAWTRRRGIMMAFWAFILFQLTLLVANLVQKSVSSAIYHVSFILFSTLFFFFIVLPPLRCVAWRTWWIDRYRKIGLCPGCSYDLKSQEVEPDGCSVCPECGDAWRLTADSA